MTHTCAICTRQQAENEPEFTVYLIGTLDGRLCEFCAKPICAAVTRAVAGRRLAIGRQVRAATRELVRAVTRRSA